LENHDRKEFRSRDPKTYTGQSGETSLRSHSREKRERKHEGDVMGSQEGDEDDTSIQKVKRIIKHEIGGGRWYCYGRKVFKGKEVGGA